MLPKIFAQITKAKQFAKMPNPKMPKDPALGRTSPADQSNVRIKQEQAMMFAIPI